MPDFEDDGNVGDSGEEDSMANFMGEEVSERDGERGHSLSGDEDPDEGISDRGARQDVANQNGEARYRSASEEQDHSESISERDGSEGSVFGEEGTPENNTTSKYVGEEDDGNDSEAEGALTIRRNSRPAGRSLRTLTYQEGELLTDPKGRSRYSNYDGGGRKKRNLVAFSKEDSHSDQEEYEGSSDRGAPGLRGARNGMAENPASHRHPNSESKDEEDGEVEEKDLGDNFQVDENGDEEDLSYREDQDSKSRFGGLRTNVGRNGGYVSRLPKAFRNRESSSDPEAEGNADNGTEDEDEEADDPDDLDFNPSKQSKRSRQSKAEDKDFDSEDDADDDDFDGESISSDESDEEYKKKSRAQGRSTKGGEQPKETINRARRNTRSLRNVSYSEASESSAKDTDEDPDDEDCGRPQRRLSAVSRGKQSSPVHSRVRKVATATVAVARGTRTSSRSVPRISYAEAEESEDEDDRAKKRPKVMADELEEEDGDTIERVLWHQPKGISEGELKEGRRAQPFVLDTNPRAELNWDDQEFYIKWKGQSYLHCLWQNLSDLSQMSGFKKVLNYMKRIDDERAIRQKLSPEEAELHDVSKEMELDLLKQYVQVERVFASRTSKIEGDEEVEEYLVKWKGLSYGESTWEKDTDISFAQDAIDEFKNREASSALLGKTAEAQRKKNKASLRKLETQPEWLKGGTLRDYQLEGLNFLMISWRNDTNVILADEMGLGKTVQSVSMLGFLQYSQQIHGPFLVVVPLSTITNWAKEFRKWLPDMNVVVYVGNRASREVKRSQVKLWESYGDHAFSRFGTVCEFSGRDGFVVGGGSFIVGFTSDYDCFLEAANETMCQKYEFSSGRKNGRPTKFDALLTTYEVVLKDKAVLGNVKWNYTMVDEAHRLKNSEASLYTTLSEFSSKNICLVTGTPLQNSVEELWALLHFLDSEKFGNKDEFTVKYKNLNSFNEMQLTNLHAELRPHLLRRAIRDVEKSLPPKIERVLRVEMSPLQRRYYKWILERNFLDLNKGVRGNNQVSLLNIVVELKKCCNHPFLFESADHAYGGDAINNDTNKVQNIVLSSGKLAILDKLLIRLSETKHRVLIFSQMVKMLDILADYLALRGFKFQRLDGSTKAELRQQAMEHFNAPGSEDFCFLLSTRAGGLGINLATADTVIIFDSDWNPQNDLQAMSRAHRIGQRDVVNIYRFVTSKSVEEDILERAKKKMVLDHLVIQKLNAQGRLEKKETKKGTALFDKSELAAILRFGAEELFKDQKSEEEVKNKLESMDIDDILERAERVENKSDENGEGNELLSAFKVANFSSAEDDASFWRRLIPPEAAIAAEEAPAPRAARNVKTYAEDESVGRKNRKRRAPESKGVPAKRSTKASNGVGSHSLQDQGAAARTGKWQGGNLSKRDANAFVKAVKKFGEQTRLKTIAKDCGGAVEAAKFPAQLQLWESLIDGCRDALKRAGHESKAAVLDFFGVPVKAQEVYFRAKELALIGKRIKRHSDPVAQFRLKSHLRNPAWSKVCGWNQVDDARLLLGIHYHGFGNWEKIRTDDRLGLNDKIAPAGASAGNTSLPRSSNLDARANALLCKELEDAGEAYGQAALDWPRKEKLNKRDRPNTHGKQSETTDRHGKSSIFLPRKMSGKSSTSASRELAAKPAKVDEPSQKEEGEISDAETTPQPSRGRRDSEEKDANEGKWHEWCAHTMEDQTKTLHRLEKLQTSYELSKEEVLHRVKKYLRLLGRKVEKVLEENAEARSLERMETRLWNYIATFSNMTGSRLSEIYKKLKEAPPADSTRDSQPAAGPSGRDSENHPQPVPNNGAAARMTGKRPWAVESVPLDANHVRDNDREHADLDMWARHREAERERDADVWQRRPWDDRMSIDTGGPGGMYSVNDRRQWEGRPGSSDGWGDRGLLRHPVPQGMMVPGLIGNGGGWVPDVRDRVFTGVGVGRGPLPRERIWNGENVFIHHGRGGGARGL